MPLTQQQSNIQVIIKDIYNLLNKEPTLVNRDLGNASKDYVNSLLSMVNKLQAICSFISTNIDKITDNSLQHAYSALKAFDTQARPILLGNDAKYLAEIYQVITIGENTCKDLIAILPLANILLLKDGAFENLENLAQRTEYAKQYVEQKLQEAKTIEANARQTASGISIESAQKEFTNGQKSMQWKSIAWGAGSVFFTLIFLGLTWHWLQNPPELKPINKDFANIEIAKLIYSFTLRATLLTTIGAVSAFSIKMLRSTLHMLEVNAHQSSRNK